MTSECYFLRKRVLLACLLLLSIHLNAQNFVLNGSFEDLTKIPMNLGDFYPEEWYNIKRGTSPDIYSMRAPSGTSAHPDWEYCRVKPFEGLNFAGLILEDKKEDYREPIGTELITRLREDSTYLFRISVSIPNIARYRMSSLDVVLSEQVFSGDATAKLEDIPTHFSISLDSVRNDYSWHTFSFEFQAKGGERYLSIGNFRPGKTAKLIELPDKDHVFYKTTYTQAYVCVDNIELFDVALMKDQEPEEPEIKAPDPELFRPITLKNLLFEVGSSVLQNTEIPELDKLVSVLKANELVSIRISGHTDNSGDPDENKELSLDRAESVATYLIDKGIDGSRISTEGFGAEVPIASNETEEGKAQNRRVVVKLEQ